MEGLCNEFYQAVESLRQAESNFNEARDPELVEAAIHEVTAAEKRLAYLHRLAKENNQKGGAGYEENRTGRGAGFHLHRFCSRLLFYRLFRRKELGIPALSGGVWNEKTDEGCSNRPF